MYRVKFNAEHIGEIFSTELIATIDYVPNGTGYLKLRIETIEDESTGYLYKYEDLHALDQAELHKAIEGAKNWIDEAMEDAAREARVDTQFEDSRERRD